MIKFNRAFLDSGKLYPHLNNYFAVGTWPDKLAITIHPNKEPDNAFHPSSASECLRVLNYKMRGLFQPAVTGDMRKSFMYGHYVHALIEWIIVEGLKFSTWDDIEKEYNITIDTHAGNSMKIRGFTDIARCNIPGHGTYLVDIKTMTSRTFSQNGLPEYLRHKYESQVQIYMFLEDIDRSIILIVEKDSPHRFKEVYVQRDDDRILSIIDGWKHVADSIVEGFIPECTCVDPNKCPILDAIQTAET